MTSRYFNRDLIINESPKYSHLLHQRGVPFIEQFDTANLTYPTSDEMLTIDSIGHIWSIGDRFYKLADSYYNDPRLWWVIAWWNKMPTEAHVEMGWIVDIPMPLEAALRLWDV